VHTALLVVEEIQCLGAVVKDHILRWALVPQVRQALAVAGEDRLQRVGAILQVLLAAPVL
jgi:hypothetical protein